MCCRSPWPIRGRDRRPISGVQGGCDEGPPSLRRHGSIRRAGDRHRSRRYQGGMGRRSSIRSTSSWLLGALCFLAGVRCPPRGFLPAPAPGVSNTTDGRPSVAAGSVAIGLLCASNLLWPWTVRHRALGRDHQADREFHRRQLDGTPRRRRDRGARPCDGRSPHRHRNAVLDGRYQPAAAARGHRSAANSPAGSRRFGRMPTSLRRLPSADRHDELSSRHSSRVHRLFISAGTLGPLIEGGARSALVVMNTPSRPPPCAPQHPEDAVRSP